MKTKRNLIAFLMAMLVMALIIGCFTPIDTVNSKEQTEPQVTPDGKILVRLNLVDSKGRTILPNTTGFTWPDSVDHFTLSVKDSENASFTPGDLSGNIPNITTITGTAIPLAPNETYTFTVIAYIDATSSSARAIGVQDLAVSSTTTTLSIVMKEIVDGTGKGTLSVAGITGYDTAELTLTPLSATGTTGVTSYDLNTADAGSPYSGLVNSGYYIMTIDLTLTGHEDASVVEVVHIYQGFTTSFSGPYPTLRVNEYLIEYDDTSSLYTGTADETVHHGEYITNLTGITPSSGTDVFGGWYTSSTPAQQTPANRITGSTKIIKPLHLYIKWESSTYNVGITGITHAWSGSTEPDFTGSTATYNQNDATITINIVVANDLAYESTFAWYVDGKLLSGETGSTLTITENREDASNWYQAGTHEVQLIATEIDGTPCSGTWQISCTDTP